MERLTDRNRDYSLSEQVMNNPKIKSETKIISQLSMALQVYEDLEEAQRLIKLPCKVGDTVWLTNTILKEIPLIYSFEIVTIEINRNRIFLTGFLDGKPISINLDYCKVYQTEQQAEAALSELNKKGE